MRMVLVDVDDVAVARLGCVHDLAAADLAVRLAVRTVITIVEVAGIGLRCRELNLIGLRREGRVPDRLPERSRAGVFGIRHREGGQELTALQRLDPRTMRAGRRLPRCVAW